MLSVLLQQQPAINEMPHDSGRPIQLDLIMPSANCRHEAIHNFTRDFGANNKLLARMLTVAYVIVHIIKR